MSYVTLDLSIRSTGWAMWSRGQAVPAHGTWELASGVEWMGRAFVRLHRNLQDLNTIDPIECLAWEDAIPPHKLHANSSADTVKAAAGLGAHALSFAEAIGCRKNEASIVAWRRHFIGKMPRGTKTPDLKFMAMKRCRELGMEPIKHDAAEAIGILDYQLSLEGIIPPWRQAHILQRELTPAGDGRRALL